MRRKAKVLHVIAKQAVERVVFKNKKFAQIVAEYNLNAEAFKIYLIECIAHDEKYDLCRYMHDAMRPNKISIIRPEYREIKRKAQEAAWNLLLELGFLSGES